jgi:hypothetical protein
MQILRASLQTRSTDRIQLEHKTSIEHLTDSFTLPGNVRIPAGRYTWVRPELRLESAAGRPVIASLEYECCAYYGGRLQRIGANVQFHPSATFGAALNEEWQDIRLPWGHTVIRTDSMNAQVNFNSRMTLRAQLQYDNISKGFASVLQFRWQIRPVTELLAVLGESSILNGPVYDAAYHSQGTSIVVRLGHRLQF